jgi:hypothetical protein
MQWYTIITYNLERNYLSEKYSYQKKGLHKTQELARKWEKLRKNTYRLAMHLEKPN